MESYKPVKVSGVGPFTDEVYYAFLVEPKPCPVCGRPTLPIVPASSRTPLFPFNYLINQSAQMRAAGIIEVSEIRDKSSDNYLCKECADAGKATFICKICFKEQTTKEIEKTIPGGLPDSLCKTCYATIPAKQWEETVDRLEDAHQYDFE